MFKLTDYVDVSKKSISLLIKDLFIFKKRNVFFILGTSFIILLTSIPFYYLLDEFYFANFSLSYNLIISYIISALFLMSLFIYKRITRCDEFEFFKASFQFFSIIVLFVLIIHGYNSQFSANSIQYFFAQLFNEIPAFITFNLCMLGFAYFIYSKKDFKELGIFFIFTSLALLISRIIYYIYSFDSPQVAIFKWSILSNALSLVFIFYSFKKLKNHLKIEDKELFFFILLSLIIFLSEYFNGLLSMNSLIPLDESVNMIDLLAVNIYVSVHFAIMGFLLYWNKSYFNE